MSFLITLLKTKLSNPGHKISWNKENISIAYDDEEYMISLQYDLSHHKEIVSDHKNHVS